MKLLFKLTLVLILASVSFTSCTKKLTQEEVQQINTGLHNLDIKTIHLTILKVIMHPTHPYVIHVSINILAHIRDTQLHIPLNT